MVEYSSSSSSSSSWSAGPIKSPIISLQNVPLKENFCHHHTIIKPTLSFSSTSSSSDDDSQPSPASPLRRFYGVPFSWEKLPGIPKKLPIASTALLPLPTPPRKRFNLVDEIRNMNCKKKTTTSSYFEKDPFFAALVECSKDEDIMNNNGTEAGSSGAGKEITRSISDRFGFINLYTSSCKNGCSVSDSILHLPRPSSSSTRRTSHHYDPLTHGP